MRERLKKIWGRRALPGWAALTARLRRFPRLRKALLRIGAILLASLLLGMAWSAWNTGTYLPTLEGDVFSMLAGEEALYMVLSNARNNCLVRVDYGGRLLNYSATPSSRAYQDLDASGETVYAIMNDFTVREGFCGNEQSLAALSLERRSMRPRVLLDLEELEGVPAGISWREVYAPAQGEKTVRLAGIDGNGQGFLLRWDPDTRRAEVERVLEGEELYILKYVSEGRLVWIGRDGAAGQEVDGVRQRDVLSGFADTPSHISTCGERCFLSDSVSGDIFELCEDGNVEPFRSGGEEIGGTGYLYARLETFTTYPEDGEIRVAGLCAAKGGAGSVVAGETRSVSALSAGSLRLLMLWEHGWQAACWAFLVLTALTELFRLLFRSHRLATRLAVGEILAALLLIGVLGGAELSFYESAVREDAGQKLQMVGRNLIFALTAQTDLNTARTAGAVEAARAELEKVLGEDGSCAVNVFWETPLGPAVGYDVQAPAGYLAEDVKNRSCCRLIRAALAGTEENGTQAVQNANNADFLYTGRFVHEGRTGCVVVSQPAEALLLERFAFIEQMALVLAACPLLFLGLILMTRRLLRPLGEVREALEEFYAAGGGNRIELAHMPRTELYEVGRVFNELSVQTRVQFNKLSTINGAYVRLVPDCLLALLGKEDIQAVSAGDFAAVDGAVLIFLPERPARTAEKLERFLEPAARCVHASGGMLVDYDEGLGAVTALFRDPAGARECARTYLADRGEEGGVTAAVFDERVEAGVFGSEALMLPLAVSQNLHRKQEVLERLSGFGAVLVLAGEGTPGGPTLRLLGWDEGLAYWEDPAGRPGPWQGGWRTAAPLWERGMAEFSRGAFTESMRTFTQVLRSLPGDGAARWYLFRSAALRDGKVPNPDLGLLYDWRDARG